MKHIILKKQPSQGVPDEHSVTDMIPILPPTEPIQTTPTESADETPLPDHSHNGHSGTVLRIGAFLTAVICSIAMVRAVKTPTFGIASDRIPRAVTTTADSTHSVGERARDTTAVTDASRGISRQTDITTIAVPHTSAITTAATQTTAIAATTAATTTAITTAATTIAATTAMTTNAVTTAASSQIPQETVSKTRTTEELAEVFAAIPLSNESKLSYDPNQIASLVPTFTVTDEPLVLIMHTHGSEGYADTDGRTQDITDNVVAVGAALQAVLEEQGIPVIHDERMYDVPSYTRSYNEAYNGIRATLEQYPSIQIVLDVHRDAYSYEDGSLLRTAEKLNTADGKTLQTARVMFLVGTDAGTLEHPTWRSHLAFAMALQTRMEDIVPGITRSVFLRRQRFNEHLTPGSLLVEVGSSGDTLEEAKEAVRIFGTALAEELLAD